MDIQLHPSTLRTNGPISIQNCKLSLDPDLLLRKLDSFAFLFIARSLSMIFRKENIFHALAMRNFHSKNSCKHGLVLLQTKTVVQLPVSVAVDDDQSSEDDDDDDDDDDDE